MMKSGKIITVPKTARATYGYKYAYVFRGFPVKGFPTAQKAQAYKKK